MIRLTAMGRTLDVTLADVRALALTLPRVHEGEVRGRVKFYVGRIVFLAFARDETMMGFGFPKEWRDAALAAEPEKFVRPRTSDLRYNWLVVRLAAIDHDEMYDLVTEAWSICVPRKVVDEWMASRASR
jgi:hypothetical protein